MHAEAAYLFRHALLRDAAYQLQLPTRRARLHRLAFGLIEDLWGGRPRGEEALALHRDAGSPYHVAFHLCDQALLFASLGRPDRAREGWRTGMARLREFGHAGVLEAKIARMKAACAAAWIAPLESPAP